MIKTLAVLCMFCNLSIFNSISTGIDLADSITQKAVTEAVQSYETVNYIDTLKSLNYYTEDSTDKKLNARNAVIRFQSDHNLTVDGVWNDKCLISLKKQLIFKDFHYPDKISSIHSTNRWIVINKSRRTLTLYEGSEAIKKYPIAIGSPSTLTPSGKFSVANKAVNPTWGGGGYAKPVPGGSPYNPLGYRWIGISYNGGDRYGIHGNASPYSIGTNASHGCIRMINSDIESLFDLIPLKSDIWLGTDEDLVAWGVEQPEY